MVWMLPHADSSMFGYDRDSGYTDGGGNPLYGNMAAASQAALRREQEAKHKFSTVSKEFLKGDIIATLKPRGKHVLPLLHPSCHLTKHCYGTFRKFVKKHAGWDVKRVEATPEEKKASGETRKGKVYFVNAVYTAPKKQARSECTAFFAATTTNAAAATTAEKPPAPKKQKLGDSTNA